MSRTVMKWGRCICTLQIMVKTLKGKKRGVMKKQIIESDRPKKYYFELCLKISQQKKLNQRERVFIELYQNEKVPCYHFTRQIKPTIIMYNSRICELRYKGFVIPPPEITYVNGGEA